ncbi:DUF6456 domain-containing protein [Pararhizobium sp. YC-54]|uniref:DUF6456 domain-containing protein n=1 Tax=Pararhizobium sp. YC-54 TaxID=2986920 RepID=UPI0021F7475C|nr:DUF6456 domain-containing protein [Pararhizobium sp. YC-54]MCV9997769.1 DUF6456 domain-containing protein [Pararhizobium sp. YC-54]
MRETDANGARATQKDIVRFVRYVATHAPVRLMRGEAAMMLASKVDDRSGDNASRPVACATVDKARSLGLVIVEGDTVRATAEAPAFLRRAFVDPQEAFLEQHREIQTATIAVEGIRQAVRVNQLESPLGAAARLKEKSGQPLLPPEAIAAGERLHADFTRAQLQPRLTMEYAPRLSTKTRGGAGGTADLCDTALAARLRVGRAMEAIGPELCGVALDVCCFQKGLEIVERERQWPARSAKLMLRTALMALSRHYAPPKPDARRSHAWGAEGYRPDAGDLVF